MSKKRKQYSNDFKAKVALATIRADETVPQLAARYGLHPSQINSWKRHLTEQASELFARSNGTKKETEHSVDDLHQMIGQLMVERDFLAKRLNH